MVKIKLTRENWEDRFNNKLVDWNNPRFIESSDNQPVRAVKEFIKQLLEDIEEDKLEQFLEWLKEEDLYPLLDHNDLVVALEEYEAEVETSSEKEVNVL